MYSFESHITVDMNRDKFRKLCEKLGVTAICIRDDTGSNLSTQLMTRKFHRSDSPDEVVREVLQLAENFDTVIRRKVEIILGRDGIVPAGIDIKYYEFHLKYNVPFSLVEEFKETVTRCGCHTAKNVLKQRFNLPSTSTRFVTARTPARMELVKQSLTKYQELGIMREAVIYDDNESVDSNWVCDCPIKRIKS